MLNVPFSNKWLYYLFKLFLVVQKRDGSSQDKVVKDIVCFGIYQSDVYYIGAIKPIIQNQVLAKKESTILILNIYPVNGFENIQFSPHTVLVVAVDIKTDIKTTSLLDFEFKMISCRQLVKTCNQNNLKYLIAISLFYKHFGLPSIYQYIKYFWKSFAFS